MSTQPADAQQRRRQAAETAAAAKAAAAGAAAAGVVAVAPVAAAGAAGAAVSVATAAVMSTFVSFLAALGEQHRLVLTRELGRHTSQPGDIADVVRAEMLLEREFARRAADRLASAMPQALAISDPAERAARVRQLLADEERYAAMRGEAMFARAIAALTRMELRRSSPLGAFWKRGAAHKHTEVCKWMTGWPDRPGRFWPWAVLDRVHPPAHYGCVSSLHGYGEAILAGWMTPSDVPDERAAVRAAAGAVMEHDDAAAVLAELDVRDQLSERGIDTTMVPFAGVELSEAFEEGRHPRDWKGRFRAVGDVAKGITDTMIAWQGGTLPSDAPSHEEIVANWTKQVRGRLSKDRGALGILKAAQQENAANPRWQAITRGRPADHVIVTHDPQTERRRTATLLASHGEAASRKAHTTVIKDTAVKEIGLRGTEKSPKDHPAATSGYGLAAVLRHEYGHSIDDTLPRDVRRRVLDAIPDAEHDLTYYAGTGDQEVIPELLATITHPDYRAADWPESVREAERRLLAALGVKLPASPADGAAEALKRGDRAAIEPKDAPALIEALADGEPSALHQLEVRGQPNLFRAHARELSRAEMPQIPKAHLPGFMDFLGSKGVLAAVEDLAPSAMQATQNQVNGAAVAALAKGWDPHQGGMIMVSRERHVLDGHHRWAAAALHELSNPAYRIQALRFAASTDRMLSLMREYNAQQGVVARRFGEGGVPGRAA